MAGYSGTPLAKKLGIREGFKVVALGAPRGYRALLAPLPANVKLSSKLDDRVQMVHVFCTRKRELARVLARCRKLDPQTVVWVSWPKRAAKVRSELTEDVVREAALPLGYVDVKVCAVDETWSGLKLVVRKALR